MISLTIPLSNFIQIEKEKLFGRGDEIMPSYYWETKDMLENGFKGLLGGIILFGSSLVILGLLIMVFPALIGFLFAGFILFVGITSLIAGYKVWKFKKNTLEFKPAFSHMRFEHPVYRQARIFIIR